MRWVLVLLVAAIAVVVVGRMQAYPNARDSARQTEDNIRGVAEVLQEASDEADHAGNVLDGMKPTKAEARWLAARNAACAARAERTAALPRPRTLDGMAEFARRWLALDRTHDRRVAQLRAPAAYAAGAQRLARLDARQERQLHRVVEAVELGDAAGTLAAIRSLQTLAVSANTTVSELRLTDCYLPAAGLPY
jgi:hypothetical protein